MGGDFGPRLVVPAVIAALQRRAGLSVLLFGQGDSFAEAIAAIPPSLQSRTTTIECGSSVAGDDKPSAAVRRKLDSSLSQAVAAVAEQRADCVVSAGNTGALMAFGLYHLGALAGVDRPAICTALPGISGSAYMLDLGANVVASAAQLHQFALLGSLLAATVGQRPEPAVKLLNIGSEAGKGMAHINAAAELLRTDTRINYCGFVEGDQLFEDGCDVVVCDGYAGNIALKTSEGLVKMVAELARQLLASKRWLKLPLLLIAGAVRKLFARLDPARYNGAYLLGLNGLVVKSHGSANQRAFECAIDNAVEALDSRLQSRLEAALKQAAPAAQ